MNVQKEFTPEEGAAYFVLLMETIGCNWLKSRHEEPNATTEDLFEWQRMEISWWLGTTIESGSMSAAGVSAETIASICEQWKIENPLADTKTVVTE